MTHRRWQFSTFLLIGMIISACVPIIKHEQPSRTDLVELSRGENIGQTILARYSGLDGIEIYINPETIVEGELFLYLYPHPQNTSKELAKGSLPLLGITSPGFYRIPIPPLSDSTNKDYYLELELEGQDYVKVGTAPGDAYLNGALYQNGTPRDTQLSFRLSYHPTQLFFGLFLEGLIWLAILVVGLWLYILPGWALLGLTLPRWSSLRWVEKLGLSAGVSLAIYPILFLWTDLVDLHLGPLYAWLPPLFGLVVILWCNRANLTNLFVADSRQKIISDCRQSIVKSLKSPTDWLPELLLVLILLLIFATRFWVIRNLDAPMWGDSYQHTMIAQLLVDNNGLFDSWAPYADLTTFTYHFGFHTLVTGLHWITGMSMPQAVLWTGQILNGLAIISLYPLAVRVGRTRWAGIITLLIAGLLLSMPMFYVNWGRYTQLAGQIILVCWVYLVWLYFLTYPINKRFTVFVGVILGGLALTHYRVLIFAVIFLLAYFILYAQKDQLRILIVKYLYLGLIAGLIFLPWFINIFAGRVLDIFTNQPITNVNQSIDFIQLISEIGNPIQYLPAIIWLCLPIFISLGLWMHEKGVALISLWWVFILLATNPHWLGLPGAGAISNFAVFIAFYIPASIIMGSGIGWLITGLQENITTHREDIKKYLIYQSANFIIIPLLILGLGYRGARIRITEVQPATYGLATRPDFRAGEWMRNNLTSSKYILVNSFFAYNNKVVVGSDAGWWLPLIADLQTTLPPLTYTIEQGPFPNYLRWINELTAKIIENGIDHPDTLAELNNRNIGYIYIGQQQGGVNSPGPTIKVVELLSSPNFTLRYHQDQVWVFEFKQ